jgi:hypothetical protein
LSQPWYDFPEINNYGFYPDPEGAFPKPDINVGAPNGTAITNLLSGIISGINSPSGAIPSWGQVVTVKLDKPLNSAATYEAYLHLGSIAPGDYIGEHVSVGDIIGYAGPSVSGAETGYALQSGPYYGFGSGFSNPGSSLLNPTAVLQAAQNNSLGSLTSLDADTSDGNSLWGFIEGVIAGASTSVGAGPQTIPTPSIPDIQGMVQTFAIQGMFIVAGLILIIIGMWTVFKGNHDD